MSYWHTPRDEWPTRIEAANEPALTPSRTPTRELIAQLVALQKGADQ